MNRFDVVDALVADYHSRVRPPGLAYGIVQDGELVHAGGLGERRTGGAAPDADTVFRIASMSKSFTASAVLMLRDEGALRLDDPAEEYVPELRGWPRADADLPRVSIRQLLTMTAGFPTDDPWGDRQQGMPLDDFGKFLAGGVSFAWVPGTVFEYSNLGYAILGRVITGVTGTAYPDFIRDRLMRPLGMTRSGFEAAEVSEPAGLASGYRRAPGGWEEIAPEPCGAFAPMGGVFSCVRDLARWVAGFASAFPSGQTQAGEAHPLRPASRREMQLPQVPTGWEKLVSFPADGFVTAYGFGLSVSEDPVLGRLVGHGGGYPGFGSHMRWHPATGTGAIALGNVTYARMQPLTSLLLDALVRSDPRGRVTVPLAPAQRPWPQTLAAHEAVNRLLESWDDELAEQLFAPNVAQDVPFAERRAAIAVIRDRIGDFAADTRPPQFGSAAQCQWWLTGDRGAVQVQIQLTPERHPRVQSLILPVPSAAGAPLRRALDGVIAWMNGAGPGPVTDERLARRLRAAAVWAGKCQPGGCIAGNGTTATTVELIGEHASLELSVTIDPATMKLCRADVAWDPGVAKKIF
jgi:CubicO group peptidase (beta-lactamase class C family)